MEHEARLAASTAGFHINLDDDENNIHIWTIINPDEKVQITTIWVKVTMEMVGSISINHGEYPGLPFVY